MDAVYYHPAGYKHHFRNVEAKDGIADLKDDDGKLVYKSVKITDEPQDGCAVLAGQPSKVSKSIKP